MNTVEVIAPNEVQLAEHAAVIRALGKRVVGDVTEIGRRLTECKRIAGHGNWLPWLKAEFGWTHKTADNFMHVYVASKSENFSNLNLPVSGLYLLAAPSTPDEARTVVVEKAKNGERLTLKQVQKMIADARKQDEKQSTAALAKAEARRVADLDKAEGQVRKLEASFAAREEKLRQQYKDRLPANEIEKMINAAVAPLLTKLKKSQAQIERLRKIPRGGGKVEPEPYRIEHMAWAAAVDSLVPVPACGLQVLARRDAENVAHYLEQSEKALANLCEWIRVLKGVQNG